MRDYPGTDSLHPDAPWCMPGGEETYERFERYMQDPEWLSDQFNNTFPGYDRDNWQDYHDNMWLRIGSALLADDHAEVGRILSFLTRLAQRQAEEDQEYGV